MERSLEHELETELLEELEASPNWRGGRTRRASWVELAGELEGEGEGEFEGEGEASSRVSSRARRRRVRRRVGGQANSASTAGEHFLGNLISGLGGLLGEGEGEVRVSSKARVRRTRRVEFEHEQGEQFSSARLRYRPPVCRAAPMLKNIARIAARSSAGRSADSSAGRRAMLGSKLAGLAAKQLREQELGGAHEMESHEMEGEFELGEHELGEFEMGEHELGEHEVASELAEHEAQAELMANFAAFTESEHEAEALAGAAATVTMSRRDRRALRALVPNLVRGAAILTRVLRMRRATRPFVRVVPTIMRRTVRTLRRGAAAGRPITRRRARQVARRGKPAVLRQSTLLRSRASPERPGGPHRARPRAMSATARRRRSF